MVLDAFVASIPRVARFGDRGQVVACAQYAMLQFWFPMVASNGNGRFAQVVSNQSVV